MTRFEYLAVDAAGREKRGGLDAADEAAARAALKRKRLLPVEVRARAGADRAAAPVDAPPMPGRARLGHGARLLITRQLATLIDAAVPVDEALAMTAAQQEAAVARAILGDVHAGVLEGQRLADALGRHPKSFPTLYRVAVAGGERTGKLGFTLTRLADYLGRAQALRAKIFTALVYPAALCVVAACVVTALMTLVVPSLIEQFRGMDARLPWITQALIFVSESLTRYWALLLGLIALAALALRTAFQREAVRFSWDAFLLRAPMVGRWVRSVNASAFLRAVSLLTMSGLPALEAVRAARGAVANRAVASAIATMAERIEGGDPLSHAMRASGVIPPMAVYMAASGENAGELPVMLEKSADHMDQDFETFTAAALALLEPAVIVVMGLVVGSIVLAIMLPILQLNSLAIG